MYIPFLFTETLTELELLKYGCGTVSNAIARWIQIDIVRVHTVLYVYSDTYVYYTTI